MKKNIKTLVLFGIIAFGSLFSVTLAQVISSRNSRYNNVPKYYYANYEFADDYDAINERFRNAKARYSTNESFTNAEFAELYQHFRRVFPHLPNKFSTTFEKCQIIARNLSNGYSDADMEALMGNACYKSLSDVINQVNSSYTVKTTATFNPNGGMAPVTITFDARGSSDPSQETIPENNFYWYYRDEKGVDMPMGSGQVIHYTFDEPGKFIVHLVVRSSNVDQGILDGEKNLTIDISPKAADIVVYANTRRMIKNEKLKIGTTEAEKGVVFDGSLTVPRGGRKIEEHQWIIKNYSETIYDSKWQKGTPSYINRELKGEGEFEVTLKTRDNENNEVSATYSLYVSDPVTVIKQTPSEGTTSATYNFDGSASYSVTKKLDKFFWEVFDANGDEKTNGAKIYYKDGKNMSINFSDKKQRPGTYMVKLTITDIAGTQNTETREIYVESTPPTPQFIDIPTKIWTYPSEFTLDASNSSDIDVENGRDSLEYSWDFSTDAYDIISTENNNEKIIVRFNEVGKHKVTLTVTDQYGKSSSISKTLDIKSTLRPEIKAIPGVITWQEYMRFESKINRDSSEIYEYNWDFGDKHDKSGQFVTSTEHKYAGKGLYTVSLSVTDNAGNTNTVKERVFIGEIDHPIAAFKIKDNRGYYIQATDVCKIYTTGGSISMEDAYPIDRYDQFTIDPSTSVNTKGNSNGLNFTFSKEQISGTISKVTRELSESFNQLGCHYVDLLVNDSNLGKFDGVRIRFNVKNALPTLKNITLTFPQYADDTSMLMRDLNNNESRASFDCTGTSNLTIKVTAIDAKDPDGTISRLRFYYYNTDDPDRILEYKDTWMNAPYTHFVIPRMGGEYKFGVMVYDNEGGMIDSKQYLANNPAIYFPPSCTDSDVPTVTLKESAQNIQVGDTVTYTIVSKISTNNEDFATDRTFYFDFTGDGIRDLVTKKDTAPYTFMEEYEDGVTPRAAVEYRRKLGTAQGGKIYVKNGIKPILLHNSIGNKVIFRDVSIGIIQQRQICLNTADCDAGNLVYKKTHTVTTDVSELTGGTLTPIKKNDVFLHTYPEYGTYNVSVYMKSKYGIEATTGFNITTKDNSNNGRIAPGVNMITIPETTFEEKITEGEAGEIKDYRAEIFLGENMNNTLLMYINNENEGTCYVDIDISTDTDKDGNADNDTNILCNKIAKITYEPEYENAIGRVWFTIRDDTGNEKLTYKNFYVTFVTQQGYILELDEQKSEIYRSITKLIDGIPDVGRNGDLKTYLNMLRKNLNNTSEVTVLVIEIKSLMNEGGLKMDSNQKEILDSIVASLSNQDTIEVSVGMSEYERNKLEILELLPSGSSIKKDAEGMFEEFENEDSQEDKAKLLDKMRDSIIKESKSIGYDESYFAGYFCNIYDYYNISGYTKKCGTDVQIINNFGGGGNSKDSSPSEGGFPLWLKIILIILVSGVLIMVGTIVFFSIKAKLSSNSEGDEG